MLLWTLNTSLTLRHSSAIGCRTKFLSDFSYILAGGIWSRASRLRVMHDGAAAWRHLSESAAIRLGEYCRDV